MWSELTFVDTHLLIVSDQQSPGVLEKMLMPDAGVLGTKPETTLFETNGKSQNPQPEYNITRAGDFESVHALLDNEHERRKLGFMFVDLDHTSHPVDLVQHVLHEHPDLPLGIYTTNPKRRDDLNATVQPSDRLLWILQDTEPGALREAIERALTKKRKSHGPHPSAPNRDVDLKTQLDAVRGELQRQVDTNRQLEIERDTLQAQLRQLEKTNALGMLAGGIAHDFNNILAALLGFTELSLTEAPPDTRIASNLNHVLVATRRAKDLVEQILAFSRRGNGEPQPVQLHLITREAVKFLRATLPSTIEIESKVNRQTRPVLAEPTQIHQVILNLATNSAQAINGREGKLRIDLAPITVNTSEDAPVPDMPPGEYNLLQVSDTGPGIDPEVQKHIFEPFFTSGKQNGTGIGLALVASIVQECGGFVNLTSEIGLGTTFDIYLPVTDRNAEVRRSAMTSLHLGHGERILLVDDEQPIVQVEGQVLHRLGYQVVSCTSSLAALELLRAQPSQFRVVVTDQTMPHMTGVELARAIEELNPEVPVILSSGFSDVVLPPKHERGNIRGFIKKPADIRELGEMIYSVLHEDPVVSV